MSNKKSVKKISKGNEKIFAIVVVAIVLVCFVVIVLTRGNKKNDDEGKPAAADIVEDNNFTSNDLKSIYGMSGEEAIEIVKKDFKSDTFEFSYDTDGESQYIVVAKNKITGSEYKYAVDPSSGSYYTLD